MARRGKTTLPSCAQLDEYGKRLLTAEEESRLGRDTVGGKKSVLARQELVKRNQRLVVSIAKRWTWTGYDLDELVQEGNIGLLRAAELYNPDHFKGKHTKFSTYATWWITQSMRRFAQGLGMIHIPSHLHSAIYAIDKGRLEESDFSQCEQKRIKQARRVRGTVSLEGLRARVCSTHGDFLEASVEPSLDGVSDREQVEELLKRIPDKRSRKVVILKFGLDGGGERTLEQIGKAIGSVTRERARQILVRALERLKEVSKGRA